MTHSFMLSNCTADKLGIGDISFLVYLFNPFTIAVCVGGSTSSIENMLIILSLYGAAAGLKFLLTLLNMSIHCLGLLCITLYL